MALMALLIVYLAYQHILPVQLEAVEYFDKRDYFNIFMCTLKVGIPGAYLWLAFFYLVFHLSCNLSAELTRFADCIFYSDWWNAGDLGEYWRKWNYPIHFWLARHVYYPLVRRGFN